MLCFTLGFVFGIIVRHWLDLHEIPQKEPHDAVEEVYGAEDGYEVRHYNFPHPGETTTTTYPQQPHRAYFYPRNGGESASD